MLERIQPLDVNVAAGILMPFLLKRIRRKEWKWSSYLYWMVSDVVDALSLVIRIRTMLKRKTKFIWKQKKIKESGRRPGVVIWTGEQREQLSGVNRRLGETSRMRTQRAQRWRRRRSEKEMVELPAAESFYKNHYRWCTWRNHISYDSCLND